MAPCMSRQQKICALSSMIILLVKRRRKRKTKINRTCWVRKWIGRREEFGCFHALQRELAREDHKAFKNFLRMDQESFNELLEKVTPFIQRKSTNMRQPISAAERLSLTLRYLASGNKYQDLEYLYRIPVPTLSMIIPETSQVIYEVLREDFLKTPKTEEEWKIIADGFEHTWNFPNCIGAMDGKHVRIKPPPASGSLFYNYKNNFSIVLLALVDADYKFIYVDVGCNGRVSDGGVFRECSLKTALENNALSIPPPRPLPQGRLPVPYLIVADAAFPLKPNIMKPYPERGLDIEKRIFNYRLSRARRIVENAFGILSNRFRVFESPFPLSPEKVESVVLAACALHNFLRSKSSARAIYTPRGSLDRENRQHEVIPGDWRVQPQPAGLAPLARQHGNRVSTNAKEIQAELKSYFNQQGQVSWQWRLIN